MAVLITTGTWLMLLDEMIFVDTSALYALMDRDDKDHLRAAEPWTDLLRSSEIRLGLEVRAIHEDVFPAMEVHWVGKDMHGMAIAALMAAQRRN